MKPKGNIEIPNFQISDLVILKSDSQELKNAMVITEINDIFEMASVIYTNQKGEKVNKNIPLCALVHFVPEEKE